MVKKKFNDLGASNPAPPPAVPVEEEEIPMSEQEPYTNFSPLNVTSAIDDGQDGGGDELGQTTPIPTDPTDEELGITEEGAVEDEYTTPDYGRVEEPSFGATKVGGIKVDDAPAYEKSEEQIAWEKEHSGQIQDIIDKGGLGIDEATQQLMRQQQFDILKSREAENLRLMAADMERRGITNSGLWFSEEQKIKSTTTRALAASMTEISIKSAFMKMASFENALGLSAQYLGYLSEQSQLAYAPKLATWQAKQQAKLAQYQAKVEVYKMKLNQAYTVNNMSYAAEIASDAAHQQYIYEKEMAIMEMEAAAAIAKEEAGMNFIGMAIGGLTSLLV